MAPCGWTVTTCGGCGKCWDGYTPDQRERAETIAATIMWAATGRRYGLCTVTVSPARACATEPLYQTYEVGGAFGYGLASPVIDGGTWYNRPAGGCCATGCAAELVGPTSKANIVSVTVDGVLVDADAYLVADGHQLVRVDGQCWPCCPSFTDPTAFAVTYRQGIAIPPAVQAGFERLACDIAKACVGAPCALPARMTRLTRQGVDIEVEPIPTTERGLILTGIKDVDDIIMADNPGRITAPPMVMTPDIPQPRRWT